MTISRRTAIAGGLGLMALPGTARSDVQCTPFNYNGVQQCQVGLPVNLSRAAQGANFQERQNWCWAACIAAVFGYAGYRVRQETIVRKVFGNAVDRPAIGPQIIGALEGYWTDLNGRGFVARGAVLVDGQYSIAHPMALQLAAQELALNRPLIIGTNGHAMVLSAMEYYRDGYGNGQPYRFTVRDPWPRPGLNARRDLSPNEVSNTQFLAGVLVQRA